MTQPGQQGVRTIDSGQPPTRFARGWHCLGLADTYKDGKPHAIQAFGTHLVIFQGEDGTLNALDGYCRHMGGNLADGKVVGNSIACPFHHWEWGGNGRCTGIPYAKRIPPRARTKAWPVLEENKQLFIWNDPQGNPPIPEQRVPRIQEVFSGGWTDWTWETLDVPNSHCREVIDNVVDMAHFFYVHYSMPRYFKNVFEGHVASQYMKSTNRRDVHEQQNLLESEAAYYGPSYMINPLRTEYRGTHIDLILINCHYPVTADSFKLQYGVTVKKPEGMDDAAGRVIGKKFSDFFSEGFLQDVEIWKNKGVIHNPLLCEEDGPVYQLRRWYEQFYVDVEDVTEDMTARFEFEIDVARSVEAWEKVVEANLAAKAAAGG